MVDDSDDKTTTFTLLLFNFFLFPQAFLSITDISVSLSVFLSVDLTSLLLFPLFFFVFFTPTCHELTTFFLSHCVFLYNSPFFFLISSFLVPHCLLSFSQSSETNTFPVWVHSSLSYFTLQPSLSPHHSVFSSLPLLFYFPYPHFSSFSIPHALLLTLTPHLLSMITFFPILQLSHRKRFHSSAFHVFELFIFCPLLSTISEWGAKLEREKEKPCTRAWREISKISLQH